jgi:hypothetical protein
MNSASRRPINIVPILLAAASSFLVGCGGGGTNGGVTASAPLPAYSDSRVTLPEAVSDSFAPNYSPTLKSDGVWRGRTLRVFFAPESEAVVGTALRRWEEATGGFFRWERVGSANAAQVTFTAAPESEFEPGIVGRTNYSYDIGRGELTGAIVRYAVKGMDADQVRVVVHEIGHVLGIHGHSDSEPDVMYPTLTLRNVITERDLNTLYWLYRDTAAGATPANRGVGEQATNTISCGD